ncbi:hypothetical protein GCM10010919_05920 [Alishewanella longhuensis]|uniref:Lipoprotein n=1 Tax=Alishewanella longhuensis TaxID=1091037 RepID=A0ABQ3KU71_9ALTE|nr:hypothetical protein [Alishewanella longhuensis]GHG61454.1 hypothetical protein GCM10010919_05920 [Alishewanella longhuensis]
MKTLLVIIALSLSACSKTSNPEDFGKEIFLLLKSQNMDKLSALAPTEDDFYLMLAKRNEHSNEFAGLTPSEIAKHAALLKSEIKNNTEEIISFGKLHGGWNSSSLEKVDVRHFDDQHKSSEYSSSAAIVLHINFNSKRYKIVFNNLVRAERGWFIMEPPKWAGLEYDPQFEKLLGKTTKLHRGQLLSCLDLDSLIIVEAIHAVESERHNVIKLFKEGKCDITELSTGLTVTIIELSKHYSSDYLKGKSKVPFDYIKISYELDGKKQDKWTFGHSILPLPQ